MRRENERLLQYINREIDIDETIGAYMACILPFVAVALMILVKIMG